MPETISSAILGPNPFWKLPPWLTLHMRLISNPCQTGCTMARRVETMERFQHIPTLKKGKAGAKGHIDHLPNLQAQEPPIPPKTRPRFTAITAIASRHILPTATSLLVMLGVYIILCALCTLPTLTMPFKPTIKSRSWVNMQASYYFFMMKDLTSQGETILTLHWSRQAWLVHFRQCPQPSRLLQCHGC